MDPGKAEESRRRKKRRRHKRRRPTHKKTPAKKPVTHRPSPLDPNPIPFQGVPAPSTNPDTPVQPDPVAPPAPPPPDPGPANELDVYSGTFGRREADRLLWRAGFGPRPGESQALAALDVASAVRSLTRPSGAPSYSGPAPTVRGVPIDPVNGYGQDHILWLDRTVRTNQPFVERMALIWHDWFATSNANVNSQQKMIDQYELFRAQGTGSFLDLLRAVTIDKAMLVWLDGIDNRKTAPNENYGREMQELFTLGADRGAYTETDVRELAKTLTGWRADYVSGVGFTNFRFDPTRWDAGNKTVFGRTGAWDWQDACRLCVEHPLHPSFLVLKLWSYFIPVPPSAAVRAKLEHMYTSGGYAIRPLVEAILMCPDLYLGEPMVKPPVVHNAGLLRAMAAGTDNTDAWYYLGDGAGQRLFYPPNVSGWNDARWLNTATMRGRWLIVQQVLSTRYIQTGDTQYSSTETPTEAVDTALAFWGNPWVTPDSRAALDSFSSSAVPAGLTGSAPRQYRIWRQNALRQLIAVSPDLNTS